MFPMCTMWLILFDAIRLTFRGFHPESFHYLCKNFPHDISRFKHKETASKRAR